MRRTTFAFALTTLLLVLVVGGVALARLAAKPGQENKRIVTFVTPAPLEGTLKEFWEASSLVAEVTAEHEGAAILADPKAPVNQWRAVTPITLKVKRVYRNVSGVAIDAGTELVVLGHYGRVESGEYVVDTPAPPAYSVGGLHTVFLHCTRGVEDCRISGPVLKMHDDDRLDAMAAPREILAMGVKRLREKLEAMKTGIERD